MVLVIAGMAAITNLLQARYAAPKRAVLPLRPHGCTVRGSGQQLPTGNGLRHTPAATPVVVWSIRGSVLRTSVTLIAGAMAEWTVPLGDACRNVPMRMATPLGALAGEEKIETALSVCAGLRTTA